MFRIEQYYEYSVMGLAAIAGQGDLVFNLVGNDPDYFYDIPSIDSVLSDLNGRSTLDSASLKYINDIEIDLDFVETLIERTKEGWECDNCRYIFRVVLLSTWQHII